MDNPLIYHAGLAALDWQFAALLCVVAFSYLVLYRRHFSPTAIINRRQRVQRELKQSLYGVRPRRVL